jgi:hypothetical protein
VAYVIDSDPRKQGMFIPGTGQKIFPPEYLKEKVPDAILILSQFHRQDISVQIKALLPQDIEIITIDQTSIVE